MKKEKEKKRKRINDCFVKYFFCLSLKVFQFIKEDSRSQMVSQTSLKSEQKKIYEKT